MSDVTIHLAGFGRAQYGTGPYGASGLPSLVGAVGPNGSWGINAFGEGAWGKSEIQVVTGAGVSVSVTGVEATGHTTGGWGVGAFGRGGGASLTFK